jgi:phosphatidylserine/phosphatidylglycerophosphate/cardiolipin synthase-like enzyme
VVTTPVSEWTDPACEWTHRTHQALRDRFAGRYFLFQLKAFDYVETWGWDETESRFVDMDTHSKLLLVDDVFVSIGSCNKHNRGFLYEGELNVAVLDADFGRATRRRVLESMLRFPVTVDEPLEWLAQLQAQAEHNGAVWQLWEDAGHDISLDGDPLPDKYRPEGFVYPLSFRDPDDCFIEGIGPDIMK